MKTHSEEVLATTSCPFALPMKSIEWEKVKDIVSLDDKNYSVIIEMTNQDRFIVEIPTVLYNAIWKSCEQNFIEQDMGFDDLT